MDFKANYCFVFTHIHTILALNISAYKHVIIIFLSWLTGRSLAWLEHSLGVREVGRSNRLAPIFYFFKCQSVLCSNAYAAFSIVSSSKAFPIIWRPIGRLFALPHGIEIAGIPAKLTGIVAMSDKYIESGSFAFSPILKATVGDVGEIKTSHCSKALSKSCLIKVLTFKAFK